MGRNKRWVGGNQLTLIRSPEEVDPSNRSNVRRRLEGKVNTDVPQVLSLFPRLTKYLDTDAGDRIRHETDPFLLGHALGELYSRDERFGLIQGLLWQERESNESREDFLERFPEVVDETGNHLIAGAEKVQTRTEIATNLTTIRHQLLDRIDEVADETTKSLTVSAEGNVHVLISPSRFDIAEWIRDQSWDEERIEHLPVLLEYVQPEGQTAGEQSLATYHEALVEAARARDIDVPAEWTDDVPGKSFEHHERLLHALNGEIREAIQLYWDEQRIEAKRQLIRVGQETLDDLNERQVQILTKEEQDNRAEEWTRYDTRQANALTHREYPLLEREESKDGRKVYYLTDLGSVVHALSGHDPITAGFPDIPERVVDGALDELGIE